MSQTVEIREPGFATPRAPAARLVRSVALTVCLVATGSCSSPSELRPGAASAPLVTLCTAPAQGGPTVPAVGGLGPAIAPTLRPPSADRIYPTNQWWTSLLSDSTFPVWVQPLAARFESRSLSLSAPPPVVSRNAVIQGFVPHVVVETDAGTVDGGTDSVVVNEWGQFHIAATHGVGTVTLAQGSVTGWIATATPLNVRPASPGSVTLLSPTHALISLAASTSWDVVSDAPMTLDGAMLRVTHPSRLAVSARPADAAVDWPTHVVNAGVEPVESTTASWSASAGRLEQSLTYSRTSGKPLMLARAPHQHGATTLEGLGSLPTARGNYTIEAATSLRWSMPEPGALLGTPRLAVDEAAISSTDAAWSAEVARSAVRSSAGSYFGPKELGYRASVLDLARSLDRPETAVLHGALRAEVDDWFDARGPGDDRWLAYDSVWGGLSASTPEFGNEDYNDHHFHYGYLIQAAAAVAQHDAEASQRWAPLMRLLAADLGVGTCSEGFAPLRVFNPYEGHSYASGFSRFADGNNQESSSEAVHAWWALARWAWVTGDVELATHARVLYATEAATARYYMLGIGADRPVGFDHRTIGILWGGKIDFATWFDPRPASIVGIQLLPITWASLYRAGPEATARAAQGAVDSGTHWADLLAMEAALADPAAAQRALADVDGFESGNSALLAHAWVDALAELGTVDSTVSSNPPLGLAFVNPTTGIRTFVAINPSGTAIDVEFTDGETTLTTLTVEPRSSANGPG